VHYSADVREESGRSLPGTLSVADAPDSQVVIGIAQEVGKTEKNASIWRIKIGDVDVSGLFVLVNREFVQLEKILDPRFA
jgi:hypothetical protein